MPGMVGTSSRGMPGGEPSQNSAIGDSGKAKDEVLAIGTVGTAVRNGDKAGSFGDVVDLDRLGKPTAPVEVRLQHIDAAVLD